jgi:hypothetical protein
MPAHGELALITQAAIIEWLRRQGTFTMSPLQRKTNKRRWIREHVLIILPVSLIVGIALGLILDRVL